VISWKSVGAQGMHLWDPVGFRAAVASRATLSDGVASSRLFPRARKPARASDSRL
jgi:hypothetical protein